jgi:hypothetical protein
MRIAFMPVTQGESTAMIYRNDGVVVALPSFSRKHPVPHDLAHAVAEREFGLVDGVFGSIGAGAMFHNMRVVAGRPRHDAVARSKRILAANTEAIIVAEIMAGVLQHAVDGTAETKAAQSARHDWGIVREDPFPWTDTQVNTAVDTLRELGRRWVALSRGEGLEFLWPDRLIETVPAGKARRRSRRYVGR